MYKKASIAISFAVILSIAVGALWPSNSSRALPLKLSTRPGPSDDSPLVWWSEPSANGIGRFTTVRLDLHSTEYQLNVLINPPTHNAPESANARLEQTLTMGQIGRFLVGINATPYTLPNKTPHETEVWQTFINGTDVTLRGFAQARNKEKVGTGPAAPPFPILWQNKQGQVGLTERTTPEDIIWALSAYHWLVLKGDVYFAAKPIKKRTFRSAAGISKDGRWLYLAVCGPSGHFDTPEPGANLSEFAEFLIGIGVEKAVNLDGGSSTAMVIKQSKEFLLVPAPMKTIPRPIPVMLGIELKPNGAPKD